MSNYKHGNWYCKPANESEAREIVERAGASGARLYETLGNWDWNDYGAWGVCFGRTHTQKADFYIEIDAIEYTITQVRQKFPLPGEQQTGWNVEGLPPVGWHGECSSDKSDWYECVVLRDGFIAHSDTQIGKEFWRVDSIDGLSFRPLSSEREQWVEQALNVLQKDPCAMPAQLMGMIYDAIKSGTLPVPE